MTFFSANYQQARSEFCHYATKAGASVETIEQSSGRYVEVASVGRRDKPALIMSSGLHGIEGFFGSAVQLAVLKKLSDDFGALHRDHLRFVFVHGINPHGFEHLRRVDERNVDLNRNFHNGSQKSKVAAGAYRHLNAFLNPESPPGRLELYRLKAIFYILRHGRPALKEAIVAGQYQYPKGIFFGGDETSPATEFVMSSCDAWVADSQSVAHLDFHTGLGEYGKYKILLDEARSSDQLQWFSNTFGVENIASLRSEDATAYSVNGAMGSWLKNRFSDRKFYFAGVEFGTYSAMRVLGAIRAENRVHFHASKDSKVYQAAKRELLECFCPASEVWRNQVIDLSLRVVAQAAGALTNNDGCT